MAQQDRFLTGDGSLDLDVLAQAGRRPAPFTPGEALFWDDPHISAQMLAAHLDPQTEAASRPSAVIDRATRWLVSYLALGEGSRVLDLGCGPGLYCERFSRHGLVVTGIDYSRRSIAYARAQAARAGLAIRYVEGNYLHLPFPGGLDAVFLIYGDLCVLPPQQRDALLDTVRAALRDGGHFICDVSTRRHRQRVGAHNSWAVLEAGFWRPGPHLLLTQGFDYPEMDMGGPPHRVPAQRPPLLKHRSRHGATRPLAPPGPSRSLCWGWAPVEGIFVVPHPAEGPGTHLTFLRRTR